MDPLLDDHSYELISKNKTSKLILVSLSVRRCCMEMECIICSFLNTDHVAN